MAETSRAGEAQILYLEPDDEIPSVVRRVRESELPRLVLVAPGRSKATSSAIGLRLLARHADEVGRQLSLVADPPARALAAEAGIPAFASIAEAQADVPGADAGAHPTPRSLAAIHVVRGEAANPPAMPVVSGPAAEGQALRPPTIDRGPGLSRMEDTQAVPIMPPVSPARAPAARALPMLRRPAARGVSRAGMAAIAVAVLAVAAVMAAVLPSARVRVTPNVTAVGPFNYTVALAGRSDSGTLNSTMSGKATGTYDDSTHAKGVVTFANYNSKRVQVPKGTPVSAGDRLYTTDVGIVISGAHGIDNATTADVRITASSPGPGSNVDTGAIDTIADSQVRSDLCDEFLFCTRRLVANRAPVTGGATKTGQQISQKDVDGLVARIDADLQRQLTDRLASDSSRVYAVPAEPQDPVVTVPSGLVGRKDQPTFTLAGTLAYDRRYVSRDAVDQAGRDQVTNDTNARPAGTTVVDSSITVEPSRLTTSGDQVAAALMVWASVMPSVDLEQLKASIEGKSKEEAVRALASIGSTTITFWPNWVTAVPRLPFRVDIAIEAAPSTTPSATPAASAS